MSLTPSTSDATSLDRATLLAAGGVLLLITALFAILGALPHDWTLHKSNIPRPMLYIAVIFVFMLAIRILYLVLATGFLGAIFAEGERLGMSPAGAVALAWISLPLVVLGGCLAGFFPRRVFIALSARAKAAWRADAMQSGPHG
jgi:hypothetical protein